MSLDTTRLRRWLSGAPLTPDGDVLSWVNPLHPGYPYPEAAGLWLNLACQLALSTADTRRRVAHRLARTLGPDGAASRAGVRYVFDTGMVIRGLRKAEDSPLVRQQLARAEQFLCAEISARRSSPDVEPSRGHWSEGFGVHQLKLLLVLNEMERSQLVTTCRDSLLQLLDGRVHEGRFVTQTGSQDTYVHAHCYALEGLLGEAHRDAQVHELVRRGAEWLSRVQRPTGGVPAWGNSNGGFGPTRADATAQSVRIWCAIDSERFADEIALAMCSLGSGQSLGGALNYEADSADENTWCSLFALQAAEFSFGAPKVANLV